MAQNPQSSGVAPGGDASGLDAVRESILSLKKGVAPTVEQVAKLRVELEKDTRAVKATNSEFYKMSQLLPKLAAGSDEYRESIGMVTAKLVESQGLLTREGMAAYESQKKLIAEGLEASKNDLVKKAAWHAKGRELEKENMLATLENRVAVGKASGMFSGLAAQGMMAQMQKYGVKAASMAGDALGRTGSEMASLAKFATIAVGVFMALKMAIEGLAGAARDAADAGLEIVGNSIGTGMDYERAMRKATQRGATDWTPGAYMLNPEEVLGSLKSATSEFIYDVGLTGQSYQTLISSGQDFRNKQRLGALEFVADAMLVGKAYGIQGDEAVKMATRMGTLGRSKDMKTVSQTFTIMAEESRRLGTPMSELMLTMAALADATDGANLSTEKLTGMTLAYYDAIQSGQGSMVGFKDMRAGEIQKHVAGLMRSLNSIDPKRIMALNQTPGGTFQTALENMYNDKMGGVDKALENAARKMKLGKDFFSKGNKNDIFGDYKLAMAMGLQGNERELISAGEQLRLAKVNGTLNPDTVKTLSAKIMDDRFQQSKSVGQNIAQGADVMQVIAGTLQNILKVMVESVNRLFSLPFFGSSGGSQTARELEQANRAQRYGRAASGGRSVSYGGA